MFKTTANKLVVKLMASFTICYNFLQLQVFSTVAHLTLVYQCSIAIGKNKNGRWNFEVRSSLIADSTRHI